MSGSVDEAWTGSWRIAAGEPLKAARLLAGCFDTDLLAAFDASSNGETEQDRCGVPGRHLDVAAGCGEVLVAPERTRPPLRRQPRRRFDWSGGAAEEAH